MKRLLNATVIPAGTHLELLERNSFYQGDIIKDKYTGQTGVLQHDLYLMEQYPDPENLGKESQLDDMDEPNPSRQVLSISFNLQILFGTKLLQTSLIKGVIREGETISVITANSVYNFRIRANLWVS